MNAIGRASAPDRRATGAWLAVLSAVTAWVSFSGLPGGFVWDDRLFFLDNDIQNPLEFYKAKVVLDEIARRIER